MWSVNGYQVDIFFSSLSYKNPIFTIRLGYDDNFKEERLLINYSKLFLNDYKERKLSLFPEFMTEEGLQKIYDLIDIMAKSIRLTSYE